MDQKNIRNIILGLFREKEVMKNLAEDEDFFDLGISSLTVVELQIMVEKELKISVPTSKLMGAPTVNEWVELYIEKSTEDKNLLTSA